MKKLLFLFHAWKSTYQKEKEKIETFVMIFKNIQVYVPYPCVPYLFICKPLSSFAFNNW